MTLKEIYGLLRDYCRWSYIKQAEKLLADNPAIDLMEYDNGILFDLAISRKSAPMLKVLLNHFEQNQLGSNPYSEKALTLKHKLRLMLEEEVEMEDAPIEIQELLKPYTFVEDTSSDLSAEEFFIQEDSINKEEDGSELGCYPELTEANLKMLSSSNLEQTNLLGNDEL